MGYSLIIRYVAQNSTCCECDYGREHSFRMSYLQVTNDRRLYLTI